jgi:hypothetical protein
MNDQIFNKRDFKWTLHISLLLEEYFVETLRGDLCENFKQLREYAEELYKVKKENLPQIEDVYKDLKNDPIAKPTIREILELMYGKP